MPILRRMGVRTEHEIEQERNALKAIRGDYRNVKPAGQNGHAARIALRAAEQ